MARSHARLYTRIWQDDEFVALSGRAQRAYLMLLSQPDVSYCGVMPYRPRRWAHLAVDSTFEGVEKAVGELETHRFVMVDRSTEELLIRSFVKNDGILDSPNMVKAMLQALRDVLSKGLQEVLREGFPEGFQEPKAKGSPRGSRKTAGKGVRGISSSSSRGNSVVAPTTLEITDEMRTWAATNAPHVDLERETDKLLDWARGKGERKKDWAATWRNWMRRESERRSTNGKTDDPTLDRDRVWVP